MEKDAEEIASEMYEAVSEVLDQHLSSWRNNNYDVEVLLLELADGLILYEERNGEETI